MSEPMMPIAHAPRLEVVLSPEGKPGPEWSEIPADALYDAYVMVYTLDGDNIKLLLDNGPFDHQRGRESHSRHRDDGGGKICPVAGSGRRAAIIPF
jgi:hypothetical protein